MVPDRGVAVGVHREHGACGPYTDGMVELAGEPDAHIEAWRDAAAGDADLPGPWLPALVGDLAGGGELGVENVEQRLQLGVVVGRDAGADAHHPLRGREDVDVVVAAGRGDLA